MRFVDLETPLRLHRDEIERRMRAVLEHGQFILGPEVAELEQRLAEYVGVRHAITTSSGTHSLEIALRALGVGPGDEVITTAFSWISPAEVVRLVGATPVFVDIEPGSFNVDVSLVEQAITARTRAILPVSLFGQMACFDSLNALATRHGLPVIEDGAQSFGATQNGRKSGGVSLIGSTSFFPAKPLGCYGDGGALFTDDDALARKMRAIRSHGAEERHEHTLVGTNGRMDTLQAAVLLGKLPRLDWELGERQRIGERYSALLRDCCNVPEVSRGNTHVYACYTIRVKDRDALMRQLKEAGIPSAVYYPRGLHEQPVFAAAARWSGLPESEKASREVLSLPMHPYLSEGDQDRVVEAVRRALGA